MKDVHVVIMAGGVGSRLYPLSTSDHPKQFIDLLDCGRTMIQLTCDRFKAACPNARFWVVTSGEYTHFVREQLPSIEEDQIIAEPCSRNTAPCIALACWKIKAKYPDSNIVVTPADAYIPDYDAFGETISQALEFTDSRKAIVTLGIQPTCPHTGYGYIQEGAPAKGHVKKVKAFREKPTLEVARQYLDYGRFWWNAGIFVWNVATIENEIRTYVPGIAEIMDELAPVMYTAAEKARTAELFPNCEKISIDYAVMEKSTIVHMIGSRWEWSDLGSFEAIEKITGKKFN